MISLGLLPLSMVLELKDIISYFLNLFSLFLHHLISSPMSVSLPPSLTQVPNLSSHTPSQLKIPYSTSTLISYLILRIVSLQWTQTCLFLLPYSKLKVFLGYTLPLRSTQQIHANTSLYVPATNVCQHPPITTLCLNSITCTLATTVMKMCVTDHQQCFLCFCIHVYI